MNVLELMDSKASSFSKTETKIYEGIKKYPDIYAKESINDITFHYGLSKPALTRFAKKLGFSGYSEFQYQFNIDLKDMELLDKSGLADKFVSILKQTEETVSVEVLDGLIEWMKKARMIYIIGCHMSRLPAEELCMVLDHSTTYPVVNPSLDARPNHFKENDVFIIYSSMHGNAHQEFLKHLRLEDVVRPHMVLITTNAKHPLRHNFNEVILLPSSQLRGADDNTLADTFAFLFFNQMLVKRLNELE